jgi:hypothetical protein
VLSHISSHNHLQVWNIKKNRFRTIGIEHWAWMTHLFVFWISCQTISWGKSWFSSIWVGLFLFWWARHLFRYKSLWRL